MFALILLRNSRHTQVTRHGRPYPPPHHLATYIGRGGAPSSSLPTTATSALALPARRDSDPPGPGDARSQQRQEEEEEEERASLKRHVTQPPAQQDLPTICPPVAENIAVPSTCAGALHALKESRRAVSDRLIDERGVNCAT